MILSLGQQYNVGKKPTVILPRYTFVVFFALIDRASAIPSNIHNTYVVTNSVRSLLDKKSKHQLPACRETRACAYLPHYISRFLLLGFKDDFFCCHHPFFLRPTSWKFSITPLPGTGGSAYLQSMDFQREPQSKHHLHFLDCFFLPLGQPDPTRPNPTHIANANPCIWCVPNLRSKDPWQWAGFSCSQYR